MSDRDLRTEVQEFLLQNGPATSSTVALGIRAGLASVIDTLAGFPSAPRPAGANPRAKFYQAKSSEPFAEPDAHTPKRGTHKQRVLELLSDGKPHTHHELYRLGVIAHSRVADLRRDGHHIDCWRDGDDSLYQLQPAAMLFGAAA